MYPSFPQREAVFMVERNSEGATTIRVSREFKTWLDQMYEHKGESYEDILKRLTGFNSSGASSDGQL
jgi:hypothetical protein